MRITGRISNLINGTVPGACLVLGFIFTGKLCYDVLVLATIISGALSAIRGRLKPERFAMLSALTFTIPVAWIAGTITGLADTVGCFLQYIGAFILVLFLARITPKLLSNGSNATR